MDKRKVIKRLPNRVLLVCERLLASVNKNYGEILEELRLEKFIEQTDFSKLNVENWPLCFIRGGYGSIHCFICIS